VELYDVMRTAASVREFTSAPVPDEVLFKILDHARFAPSGGNRQGWRVLVVRDAGTRQALADLALPTARRYAAQVQAGEMPWNSVHPTSVDAQTIASTSPPSRLSQIYITAPVLLVICVDLQVVASMDQYLERVGVVSGASIYPFVWNVLLAARQEGFGGTITTMPIAQEPRLQALLGIPSHVAVAAVVPLGQPAKQLSKLKRKPVSEVAMLERWGGPPFGADVEGRG
jgi:nitroreductase